MKITSILDHPFYPHVIRMSSLHTFTSVLPQPILDLVKIIWNFAFQFNCHCCGYLPFILKKIILTAALNFRTQYQNSVATKLCFISHHSFLSTTTYPLYVSALKIYIQAFPFSKRRKILITWITKNTMSSNNPGLSLGLLVEKLMQIHGSRSVTVLTVITCNFSSVSRADVLRSFSHQLQFRPTMGGIEK